MDSGWAEEMDIAGLEVVPEQICIKLHFSPTRMTHKSVAKSVTSQSKCLNM